MSAGRRIGEALAMAVDLALGAAYIALAGAALWLAVSALRWMWEHSWF